MNAFKEIFEKTLCFPDLLSLVEYTSATCRDLGQPLDANNWPRRSISAKGGYAPEASVTAFQQPA